MSTNVDGSIGRVASVGTGAIIKIACCDPIEEGPITQGRTNRHRFNSQLNRGLLIPSQSPYSARFYGARFNPQRGGGGNNPGGGTANDYFGKTQAWRPGFE